MKLRSLYFALVAIVVVAIFLGVFARGRSDTSLPVGATADRILVDKSERSLKLMTRGGLLKTYRIALGPNPEGHKQQEGDGRTPEGTYVIDFRKRDSAFHRALHISYPNAADRTAARKRGVSPGGDIMVHGLPNGMSTLGSLHLRRDWTQGCIAVTSDEIEQIWRVVPDGTAIEIRP
jgi:murein L,D-transpeptidase YafK